jgi:hypothetical protein
MSSFLGSFFGTEIGEEIMYIFTNWKTEVKRELAVESECQIFQWLLHEFRLFPPFEALMFFLGTDWVKTYLRHKGGVENVCEQQREE